MLHRATAVETRPGPASLAPATLGTTLCCIVLVSIWCLGRSYHGIVGDAILYVGRGLADLDPAGIGRDLMFVDDGQSRFSLFTLGVRDLLTYLAPGQASLLLVASGQALWLAAIGCLALRLHAGHRRLAFAALICIAVLPSAYGPFQRLHFAEPLAVPRPFAEAIVLFALAALLQGRDRAAAVLLSLACLLHPIMALAGVGTWVAVKAHERRLWLALAILGSAAVFGAGWLGLPLAERLFMPLDAEWRAILLARSPMLFPSHWAAADYAAIFVQAVTLCLAAGLSHGRPRAPLIGALIVGLGGLGLSEIFGDRLSLLLFVQAQPWRALWLMAVLAAVGLAQCGVVLLRGPPASRLTFVFLVLGWCFIDWPLIAWLSAGAAVTIHGLAARRPLAFHARMVVAAGLAVGSLALIVDVKQVASYVALQMAAPAGSDRSFVMFWDVGVLQLPIALAAVWWACRGAMALRPVAGGLLATALLIGAIRFWDDRAPLPKQIETEGAPAGLARIVDAHPGSVLWVDGIDETLFWLHRANWYSTLQGTSAVFSKSLAVEWEQRKNLLIEIGFLPDAQGELPWDVTTRPLPDVTLAKVQRLCARVDGLAWIVLPVLAAAHDPAGAKVTDWRPPTPLFRIGFEDQTPHWSAIDHYAFMACAANPGDDAERPVSHPDR